MKTPLHRPSNLQALLILFGLIVSPQGLFASDFLDEDYSYRIYKDRAYIDQALEQFERRHGRNRSPQDYYEDEKQFSNKDDEAINNDEQFSLKDGDGIEQERQCDRQNTKRYQQSYQCIPPRQVKRKLKARGWHDFKLINNQQNHIELLATNFNGRRFQLVVTKCYGQIVQKRPLRRYWGWNRYN